MKYKEDAMALRWATARSAINGDITLLRPSEVYDGGVIPTQEILLTIVDIQKLAKWVETLEASE